MHGRTNTFVHGLNHLQRIVALGRKLLIHFPNDLLDTVQFQFRDVVARARLHRQIDGQVIPFYKRKKSRLDLATADEPGHGNQENRRDYAKHHPRLLQAETQHRRIDAIAHSVHQIAHEPFDPVRLEIPAQCFGMTDVSRKNQRAFHEGEHQCQNDDRRHIPEKVAESPFDIKEGREGDHRGENSGKHGGQDFQGSVDRGIQAGSASFVVLVDVFSDDNAVVHQNANHEDHSKQ